MHRSFPKPARRLTDKTDQRRERALAWRIVCAQVDRRDNYRCRVCGKRTVRTLSLVPERAEHHHLVPRSRSKTLQFDPRNVILVCAEDHGKLTRYELTVAGSLYHIFPHETGCYLNAEGPLTFREVP